MNEFEYRYIFQQNLFPMVHSTISHSAVSISLDNGLVPNRRQVIIWTNDGPVYWPKFASLGLDLLILRQRGPLHKG